MAAAQGHQAAVGRRGAYPPPTAPRPAGGLPYATGRACRRAAGLLLGAALLAGYAPLPPSLPAHPALPQLRQAPAGPVCGDNRGGCFAKPPPWAPRPRSVPGERHERLFR